MSQTGSQKHFRFPSSTLKNVFYVLCFFNASTGLLSAAAERLPEGDVSEGDIRNFVSEHEKPAEIPTKVLVAGNLATPAPDSEIPLHFVPRQTYYQVRRYDTELHLPRSAALADASTPEEVINAPRLREVITHHKNQEVYEEQGYEDTAYDHGGQKKKGEHHEVKDVITEKREKTKISDLADQSTEPAEIVTQIPAASTESTTTLASANQQPNGGSGVVSGNGSSSRTGSRSSLRARQRSVQGSKTSNDGSARTRGGKRMNALSKEENQQSLSDQKYGAREKVRTQGPSTESVNSVLSNASNNYSAAGNKDDIGDEPKFGEETKLLTFREKPKGYYRTEENIEPTTYRPATLPIVYGKLLKDRKTIYPAPSKDKPVDYSIRNGYDRRYQPPADSGTAAARGGYVNREGYRFENPYRTSLSNEARTNDVSYPSNPVPYDGPSGASSDSRVRGGNTRAPPITLIDHKTTKSSSNTYYYREEKFPSKYSTPAYRTTGLKTVYTKRPKSSTASSFLSPTVMSPGDSSAKTFQQNSGRPISTRPTESVAYRTRSSKSHSIGSPTAASYTKLEPLRQRQHGDAGGRIVFGKTRIFPYELEQMEESIEDEVDDLKLPNDGDLIGYRDKNKFPTAASRYKANHRPYHVRENENNFSKELNFYDNYEEDELLWPGEKEKTRSRLVRPYAVTSNGGYRRPSAERSPYTTVFPIEDDRIRNDGFHYKEDDNYSRPPQSPPTRSADQAVDYYRRHRNNNNYNYNSNHNNDEDDDPTLDNFEESPWVPMIPVDSVSARSPDIGNDFGNDFVSSSSSASPPRTTGATGRVKLKTPQSFATSYSIEHTYYSTPHLKDYEKTETKMAAMPGKKPIKVVNREKYVASPETRGQPVKVHSDEQPKKSNYKTSYYQFDYPNAEENKLESTVVEMFPSVEIKQQLQQQREQSHSVSTGKPHSFRNSSAENEQQDIEVMPSNRHLAVLRATQQQRKSADSNDTSASFNSRHPYLPKETASASSSGDNQSSSTDNVTRPPRGGNLLLINDYRNVSKLNGVAAAKKTNESSKFIVYPSDYYHVDKNGSSNAAAQLVEKLTLAQYSDSGANAIPFDYQNRANTPARQLNTDADIEDQRKYRIPRDVRSSLELVNIFADGTTTEIPVDTVKYPFYKNAPSDGLGKYSVLRYASNPRLVPRKTDDGGRMVFYESRNGVNCAPPTGPKNIVPQRSGQEDGDAVHRENLRSSSERQRIVGLGDKILCFKTKFFGSDPLDNPFFKERSVGFPEVFNVGKVAGLGDDVRGAEAVSSDWFTINEEPEPEPEREATRNKRSDPLAPAGAVTDADNANNRSKRVVHRIHLAGGFINGNSNNNNKEKTANGQSSSLRKAAPMPPTDALKQTNRKPHGATGLPFKRNYVDAYSSLRNLQNSSKIKSRQLPYELTERRPERSNREHISQATSQNQLTSDGTSLDSLLYVMSPITGAGKWMRLLKVEPLSPATETQAATDSSSTSVPSPSTYDELRSIWPSKNYDTLTDAEKWYSPSAGLEYSGAVAKNYFDTYDQTSTSRFPPIDDGNTGGHRFDHLADEHRSMNKSNKLFCDGALEHQSQTENNIDIPYDVYHVSGLLNQLNPTNQNIKTPNQSQYRNHRFEGRDFNSKAIENIVEASSSSSLTVPQPHERLYYYVLDERNN